MSALQMQSKFYLTENSKLMQTKISLIDETIMMGNSMMHN
jgi:hypothetical protein